MNKYLVFVIIAYNLAEGGQGIADKVVIELIDTGVEEAISRAKTLVKRTNYQINDIIEKAK
jgi:hypothetical protein